MLIFHTNTYTERERERERERESYVLDLYRSPYSHIIHIKLIVEALKRRLTK